MAVLDYTDLETMNSLVVDLTGLSAPADLDSLLTDSAATHTGGTITVFRPYYVAALVLDRQLNTRRLVEARGAKFDRPSITVSRLLQQQRRRDEMLAEDYADFTIPDGHTAAPGTARVVF